MSDYTPTTEQIREDYWALKVELGDNFDNDARAEFDRWLAEVKAQAWADGWHAKDTDVNPYRQGETR